MTDKKLAEAYRRNAADEESTATALRDKAEQLEHAGDFRMASTYFTAAAKAEQRAQVWRGLLA
ncbi:hypothetical protein AB0K15_18865 [Amycolatopsis sp. NPDC049253]|uniref:hypothetical protein n=1 Tax=Amycolatopsis sp. NPDC049253 TaxID=3155274 RepID=UPI0034336FEA